MSYDKALKAFQGTVGRLGVEYLDLYLIHWPGTARLKPDAPQHADNRIAAWRALEAVWSAGLTRAIGVSNFTRAHLVRSLSTGWRAFLSSSRALEFFPFAGMPSHLGRLLQETLLPHCKVKPAVNQV